MLCKDQPDTTIQDGCMSAAVLALEKTALSRSSVSCMMTSWSENVISRSTWLKLGWRSPRVACNRGSRYLSAF